MATAVTTKINRSVSKIRNIGFIAHIDAGKTTVTENVLYVTGMTHRVGNIDEGNTVMDFMDIERERGITIGAAATTTAWRGHEVNIIDTPGHVDFTAEVERSLRVLDGGVVVIDAVAGVQPQSETVWRQADKYSVPRCVFINKMDRAGADFFKAIESIKDRLKGNPVAIQIPIGAESEFIGAIDLITRKAYRFVPEASVPEEMEIPEGMADDVEARRAVLIEKVAEADDDLMMKFLVDEEITEEELAEGLRKGTIAGKIQPTLCGSALRRMGIAPILDAIVDYLPSPMDVPPAEGVDPKTDEKLVRLPSLDEPFAAIVFKVVADQHVGRLVYLRVYSGKIVSGENVFNPGRRQRERVGRLMRIHAESREDIKDAGPGEIVAAIGLKKAYTGDTICDQNNQVVLESITFPDPVVSVAVEPKTRGDQEKMDMALVRLADEDPTFIVRTDEDSGQIIIAGMGELHLDVTVDRMRREFHVDVNVGEPRVAYRETISRTAAAEGRFIRQTGGHGQYGDVRIRLEPVPTGEGIQWESEITGAVLPMDYQKAAEAGYREAVSTGILAGYETVDIKAVLTGGSFHEVDSSEMAFKIASSMAFKTAAAKASPILLEPVMKIEVVTPSQFLGDCLGDLSSRRAQIQSMEGDDTTQTIKGMIPLSETFRYATDLRSITTGRATFSLEFDHYSPAPRSIIEDMKV